MSAPARLAAAAGLLLLAGCETALVGEAPSGRYELVRVEGQALPYARDRGGCRQIISAGHFELDPIARRFAMELDTTSSCAGGETIREAGTYLRRGGTLTLETDGPFPRSFAASESGRTLSLSHRGLALRFAQRLAP